MTNRLLNSRNQGVKLWLVSMALFAPAVRGCDYTICFQKVTDGHCEVAMYSDGRPVSNRILLILWQPCTANNDTIVYCSIVVVFYSTN